MYLYRNVWKFNFKNKNASQMKMFPRKIKLIDILVLFAVSVMGAAFIGNELGVYFDYQFIKDHVVEIVDNLQFAMYNWFPDQLVIQPCNKEIPLWH